MLEALLKKIIQANGSDLHLKCGLKPHLRVDGDVVIAGDFEPITDKVIKDEIFPLLTKKRKEFFDHESYADFSIERRDLGARFRGSIYLERGMPAVTLRIIPTQIPTFESLGLPASVLGLTKEQRGMVLVTGPTGSGKSTTLACMIDHINANDTCHIITLEDPIEFVHTSKKSLISQRELGEDFMSFPHALRAALRQDPDVIMVGELRDLDTIRLALHAAETGHLVFGTLHTLNAAQTISRMIDMFPPHEQTQVRLDLAELLRGVVAIRLLRKNSGGRIPASEVMTSTGFIKKLIAENKLSEINRAIEQGAHYGMQSFLQSLLDIYHKKMATFEECQAMATNPDDFATRARGISSGT
ncbi:MAG: PilT/PilU family type 4a pilus ATPase [Elusimicrobiota bacterium]